MQKNKIILIVGAVIVLISLLVAIPMLVKKPESAKTESNGTDTAMKKPEAKENDETTLKGSILDLLKLNKALKCTFTMSDTSGTTYISDKKIRGDFTIKDSDGKTIESHMISDGTYAYSWTNIAPQGIKIKMPDAQTAEQQKTDTNYQELMKNYDYKCRNWIVDSSKFDVPTDITFSDMSKLLEDMGGNKSLCAACDYAQTEADKTACKERLGCK